MMYLIYRLLSPFFEIASKQSNSVMFHYAISTLMVFVGDLDQRKPLMFVVPSAAKLLVAKHLPHQIVRNKDEQNQSFKAAA
jgi:hypothetical protein